MGRSNKGKQQEDATLKANQEAQKHQQGMVDSANAAGNKAIDQLQATPGYTNQEIGAMQGEQAAQLHGLYGGSNDSILRHAAITGHANDAGYAASMNRNLMDRGQAMAQGKLSIQRDNANQSINTRRMIPGLRLQPMGVYAGMSNATLGANSSLIDSRMQADNAPTFLQQMALAGIQAGGAIGAGAATHCWIAEAIYGKHDRRTQIVRYYLGTEFNATPIGSVVMAAYRKFGRTVAAWVKRSKLLRTALTPLFNLALDKALDSAILARS